MPAWTPFLIAAAKTAAKHPVGQKAIGTVVAGAGTVVTGGVRTAVGKKQAAKKNRALAHSFARQVHGKLSTAIFIGSDTVHFVVWKDGDPLAAFPPVEGDLQERAELKHVQDVDLFDPPPESKKKN